MSILIKSKSNKVNSEKSEWDFEPSMKSIRRITETLTREGAKIKTNLSQDVNLNYTRLIKHVIWLEKKGLVKLIIDNSRIKVDLTEKGRMFADVILNAPPYSKRG